MHQSSNITPLKKPIKSALLSSGVLRVAQSLLPEKLVILRYHSVRENPAELDAYISTDITHSVSAFRAQMEYLATSCQPILFDDIPDFVNGRKSIPKRAVAVTFDDGYRDNYELVAPILEEYGLQGVFYISTSAIDGRPLWFVRLRYWTVQGKIDRQKFLEVSSLCATLSELEREEVMEKLEHANSVHDSFSMTWTEARDLVKRGHIIGSHTINHPNLAKAPSSEMHFEIQESRRRLEKELARPVRHFSYPNPILVPHWSCQTVEACRGAGYTTAVTSVDGPVRNESNPLALPRQSAAQTLKQFVWNLEMAFCGRKQ